MTDKEKLEKLKKLADAMYYAAFNLTTDASLLRKAMEEYHQFIIHEYHKEDPVSEELEEAANFYADTHTEWFDADNNPHVSPAFKAGAKWQKQHLWKPADGDDLPEIDREVIVLVKYSTQRNIHDEKYPTYRVEFGHRPNPKGWEGKSVTTGKVEHYTPKLYDKGGWNIPDIVYWLDVELPKEIEL